MDKFNNKYRIPTTRLPGYDYGAHGAYYVTICCKNRFHYFGEIVVDVETGNCPSLHPTTIGRIATEYWIQIPQHFPFVELDKFIVMPNHIHGILFFNKPDKQNWVPNQFGVQSQNLGAVIRSFKSSVKRYANNNQIEFAWQSRFYDHIIRDEKSLNNIRAYIENNPIGWNQDELNDYESRNS